MLDVLHFMRQHAGQFLGAGRGFDHALVDDNDAARQSVSVHFLVFTDIPAVLVAGSLREFRADVGHGLGGRAFLRELVLQLELRQRLFADADFGFQGHAVRDPLRDGFALPPGQQQRQREAGQDADDYVPFAPVVVHGRVAALELPRNAGRCGLEQRPMRGGIGHCHRMGKAIPFPGELQGVFVEPGDAHRERIGGHIFHPAIRARDA
jgi:hypothetical protein